MEAGRKSQHGREGGAGAVGRRVEAREGRRKMRQVGELVLGETDTDIIRRGGAGERVVGRGSWTGEWHEGHQGQGQGQG